MIKNVSIALLVAVAGSGLSGCSGDQASNATDGVDAGEVRAQLRVDNTGLAVEGTTTTVDYDLSCSGESIKAGVLPVPLDGSTISGFFGSVRPADECSVTLSTTVQLDADLDPTDAVEDTVFCSASSETFDVGPGEAIDLGEIVLTCVIDETSDITFSGSIDLVNQSLDTFFVGPLSIAGDTDTGEVPPVSLMIAEPLQDDVDYAWSVAPATAGTFEGCDTTPESCEFFCAADGTHTISLTANFGDTTLTRSVDVTCSDIGIECGDGELAGTEECDDGNSVDGDGCSSACQLEECGDGVVNNNGEECDDGNTTDGDGCTAECVTEVCGDGVVNNNGAEACDDGNDVDGDGCESDCTITTFCGDGNVDAGEECDDGNTTDGDGCTAECVTEVCGDGTVNNNGTEACDDGNDVDGDGCESDCTISPVCGDGNVDAGEECDDGNAVDGDGCESDCTATVEASECSECLDSDLPAGLNASCTAVDECGAVRECVAESNCFQIGKSPSECYCGEGIDINDCQAPAFVPQGACADEITAATALDGNATDNATVVGLLAADGTTSGLAFTILIGASQFGFCIDECTLDQVVVDPVCGDGTVDAGEECDDGNAVDGDGCESDCTITVEDDVCNDCLDTDLPPGLNTSCTDVDECAAVRDCVSSSDCFQVGKSPSECYCGAGVDINDCQAPAFVPEGLCADEITAATALDGNATDNATVVGLLAADGTTSGLAFTILIGASQFGLCVDECTLQ